MKATAMIPGHVYRIGLTSAGSTSFAVYDGPELQSADAWSKRKQTRRLALMRPLMTTPPSKGGVWRFTGKLGEPKRVTYQSVTEDYAASMAAARRKRDEEADDEDSAAEAYEIKQLRATELAQDMDVVIGPNSFAIPASDGVELHLGLADAEDLLKLLKNGWVQ